jgi:methylated-DNA-[protein]-cysteine S-methyltransferase
MADILIQYVPTPFGELVLGSFEDELCLCDWRYRSKRSAIDARIQAGLKATFREQPSPLIERANEQLIAYCAGERMLFDLPLRLVGTEFQQRVWQVLRTIAYGTTTTYKELTDQVADPGAIRAVASANGANALSIIVPCHRVIGSSGELVGYAGGLTAKRNLLRLEGSLPQQLDLFTAVSEVPGER